MNCPRIVVAVVTSAPHFMKKEERYLSSAVEIYLQMVFGSLIVPRYTDGRLTWSWFCNSNIVVLKKPPKSPHVKHNIIYFFHNFSVELQHF